MTRIKLIGAGVLLLIAISWIVWLTLPKDLLAEPLPKDETTTAIVQSAALRSIIALNKSMKPLTSIAEIAPDANGKPGTKDAWGTDLVLTMEAIKQSQNLSLKIISAGADKQVGTPDDITLTGEIEYIPQYKEYSLASSAVTPGN